MLDHVSAPIPKLLVLGILLFTALQSTAQISQSKARNSSGNLKEPAFFKTMKKAEAHWKSGEFDKAVSIYEKLADTNSKNTNVLNILGSLYAYQGRYAKAVTTLSEALRLDPEHTLANYNLSIAYFHLKQFKMALAPAQRAARLDPNNLKARTHLCELNVTIAKNSKAIKCFEALELRFEPNPRTRISFALLLMKTDNLKNAISLLEDSVRIFPKNAVIHNVLGLAYLNKKKYRDAIKILQRSTEIDPKLSFTRFNLAFAYLKKRNKKAALEQYQILRGLDRDMAKKFYRILYSDKVIFADGK